MEVFVSNAMIEREPPPLAGHEGSLADLFVVANRELAQSDARIYRSVDRHLKRVREILDSAEDPGFTPSAEARLLQPNSIGVEPSFHRQTRGSLREICRKHGVTGFSRMTKDQMIAELAVRGVQAPPVPLEALTKKELIQLLCKQAGT
jgi:hypothetical protein